MSKRNKKKLKKILRAQLSASRGQIVQSVPVTNESETVNGQSPITSLGHKEPGQDRAPEQDHASQEIKEVRSEVKKIILIVIFLVGIILVLYFINNKTDIILRAGEWLATKFNVNV